MINLQTGIAILALFLILFAVLVFIKPSHEGFTDDYPDLSSVKDENPLNRIVKKLGKLGIYLANPKVWKELYAHSQTSLTDLARKQIAKDKKS